MKTSKKGIDLIKSFEQCRLKAYMPTEYDRWTIGWGQTGRDINQGTVWTQEIADERLAQTVAVTEAEVNRLVGDHSTSQNQFDALVSFDYNEGGANLGSSTLLRKHNAGDFKGAKAEFARWNKQNHTVLNGLTRRRTAEAALYDA